MSGRPKRAQLEWNLLVLVTAALVLFGLVMVYSATSASAALGGRSSTGYLERQVVYAFAGLVLLVVASRTDFRRLRELSPALIGAALLGCLADPRFMTFASEREESTAGKKAADPNGWLAALRQRFTPPAT